MGQEVLSCEVIVNLEGALFSNYEITRFIYIQLQLDKRMRKEDQLGNPLIGKRIKELREKVGISRSLLAIRAGVSSTTVWNWEENGRVPGFPTLVAVADVLGTSDYFLRTGTELLLKDAEPQEAVRASSDVRNVAVVIEEARSEIADIMGVSMQNVRLKLECVSN